MLVGVEKVFRARVQGGVGGVRRLRRANSLATWI